MYETTKHFIEIEYLTILSIAEFLENQSNYSIKYSQKSQSNR